MSIQKNTLQPLKRTEDALYVLIWKYKKMQCVKQCLEGILSFVFVFKDINVNTCACTEYLQKDTHTRVRVMMLVGSKKEKLNDSWTGAADSCFTVYLWNFVLCVYWKLFKRLF